VRSFILKHALSLDFNRDSAFTKEYPNATFDQVLWKQFWYQKQKYHTLCLPCISDEKNRSCKIASKLPKEEDKSHTIDQRREFGGVMLEEATRAILAMWYNTARDRVFGSEGRKRNKAPLDISDDDEEDIPNEWANKPLYMTDPSTDVAVFWLRSARARLQNKRAEVRKHSPKRFL